MFFLNQFWLDLLVKLSYNNQQSSTMKGPFVKFCMCFCFLRCGSCPSTRVSLIATYSRLLRMLLSVSRDGTICSIKHFKCGSKIALCKNRPYTVLYTPVQHIGFFFATLKKCIKSLHKSTNIFCNFCQLLKFQMQRGCTIKHVFPQSEQQASKIQSLHLWLWAWLHNWRE